MVLFRVVRTPTLRTLRVRADGWSSSGQMAWLGLPHAPCRVGSGELMIWFGMVKTSCVL